ncbi:TPA: ADP-ribosyltransferase [Staphylococcus pseudintermedius]
MDRNINKLFFVFSLFFSLVFSFNTNISLAKVDFDQDLVSARAWADHTFKLTEGLSNEEINNLKRYTGSKYDEVNTYLRENNGKGDDEKLNIFVDSITMAISKSKAPDDLTLYRRVTEQQFGLEYGELRPTSGNFKINQDKLKEIKDKYEHQIVDHHNFMSTSLARDPHQSFGGRQAVLLKINAPKGTEVMNVSSISKYPEQLELLVNRGYKIRYNTFDIKENGGKEYVEVTVDILPKA